MVRLSLVNRREAIEKPIWCFRSQRSDEVPWYHPQVCCPVPPSPTHDPNHFFQPCLGCRGQGWQVSGNGSVPERIVRTFYLHHHGKSEGVVRHSIATASRGAAQHLNIKQRGHVNNKMALAAFLRKRSAEICRDSGCTEDTHNCDSYAYITADYQLLDICMHEWFATATYAAISLPWTGSQSELEKAVDEDIREAK